MENQSQPAAVSRALIRLPGSLRARLIAANILIVAVSIAVLGYYVFYRGQQSTTYLTNELDSNVRQKAIDALTSTSLARAETLNNTFTGVRQRITEIGVTTNAMLVRQSLLETSAYWDAKRKLGRLQNGSWSNTDWTEPASVFIPASRELTEPLAAELNTLKQLDFTVPNVLKNNSDIVAIYFGGPSGETLYYPNVDLANIVPPDFDVTTRPWYVAAMPANNPQKGAVWSAPYLDAARHGLIITSSFPVFDAYTGFRGVVAMDVQLVHMSELVSSIKMGKTGYAFVIDKDGRLIAMPDAGYKDLGYSADVMPLGDPMENDKLPEPLPPALTAIMSKMRVGQTGLDTITIGGRERYIIYRPIAEVGYSLAIIVPTDELLAGAVEARQRIQEQAINTQVVSFMLMGLILLLAVAATWRISNTLIGPLVALTTTAQEITAGNQDARARVQGSNEIATLAHALNTMTGRLRDLILSLEKRVKDRTAALEAASRTASRRASQFEAITQVTRAIGSIRNMDELMPLVAAVISQYFEFYHVGIFLNDEHQENTWLIAANSEGGHRMLQRRHNLKIGAQGIVGFVAAHGESRVARSVGEDAVFFNNPDLPETKSEAALPLRRGAEIAGVLDVQSTKEDAFSDEDLSILAILADQVSLAMENTRLFETTRRSLMEAETLYRQFIQEAWGRLPQEGQVTGYRYTPRGASPIATPQEAAAAQAMLASQEPRTTPPIVVPIKLRGETIGNLVVTGQHPGGWSRDQIELAQAVAERVALSAENARLFDETSRRAERERLVTEITSRIRSTNDPDEMIRTAVEELRNVLGATEIQIIPQVVPNMPPSQAETTPPGMPDAVEALHRGNGANR